MVTLATAVDADDTTWHLSEALPAATEFIVAEDELVAVVTPAIRPNQREDPTLYCEVVRGWAGVRAAHAQGITLEPSEDPPLGGGGVQTFSLLGPFHVVHDDDGLQDSGLLLVALDSGTWLWGVAIIGTEPLQPASGTPFMQVTLAGAGAADMDGGWSSDTLTDFAANPNPSLLVPGSAPFSDNMGFRPVALQVSGGGLYIAFAPDDIPTTAGEWDIYALIAEPA